MIALVLVGGCPGPDKPPPQPPKRPNNELIVGDFEQHKPVGENAMRFDGDGKVRMAKNRADLDHTPHLADGTYTLEKDQLTITFDKGLCDGAQKQGIYTVVISKIGIHFTKVSDSCESRSHIDGQTWWRVK